MLRALFPIVLLVLVATQLRSFVAYQYGERSVPLAYALLLREPGRLPFKPRFSGFFALREAVAGVRVWVPQGVEVDTWSWRRLALADLQPLEERVPIRPARLRGASVANLRVFERRVFLLEPAKELKRGPLVLLSAGQDLFLAPESRLEELRHEP
jgi:hypothetical protein